MAPDLHRATGEQLSAAEVYGIWRIRDLVFAVEQRVRLGDVDGIDLNPDVTHLWFAEPGEQHWPSSYLRSYRADGVRRIGRVCTLREHRGHGLSSRLIAESLKTWGDDDIRIGAQAYLEGWYARFGFTTDGPHYDDAGIDHVPMIRKGQL